MQATCGSRIGFTLAIVGSVIELSNIPFFSLSMLIED